MNFIEITDEDGILIFDLDSISGMSTHGIHDEEFTIFFKNKEERIMSYKTKKQARKVFTLLKQKLNPIDYEISDIIQKEQNINKLKKECPMYEDDYACEFCKTNFNFLTEKAKKIRKKCIS